VAVLTGRRLRTALRAGGGSSRQKNAGGDDKRQTSQEKIKSGLFVVHVFLLEDLLKKFFALSAVEGYFYKALRLRSARST
jgi:hypothetical protein